MARAWAGGRAAYANVGWLVDGRTAGPPQRLAEPVGERIMCVWNDRYPAAILRWLPWFCKESISALRVQMNSLRGVSGSG